MEKSQFCEECGRFLGQKEKCPKCDLGIKDLSEQKVDDGDDVFYGAILLFIIFVSVVVFIIVFMAKQHSGSIDEYQLVLAYSTCTIGMKEKVKRPETIRIKGLNDVKIQDFVKKNGDTYTVEASTYSRDWQNNGMIDTYVCVVEEINPEEMRIVSLEVEESRIVDF